MTTKHTVVLEAKAKTTAARKTAVRDFDKTGKAASRAEKQSKTLVGTLLSVKAAMVAAAAAATFLGAAIGGFFVIKAVSQFSNFEQGLKNVQAVSRATAEELKLLEETALNAAAATKFDTSEATEGLYAMASAGFTVQEQMAGLRPVLDLAAATAGDLGGASEQVVMALRGFGLAATEAGRVADVLTASTQHSALNAERLTGAISNAAAISNAYGQELEGTVAALGVLTTALGDGSVAGTSLSGTWIQMTDKAKEAGVEIRDQYGKMLPLVDIIERFEEANISAGDAMDLFGARGGKAMSILLGAGSEQLREMEANVQANGQAMQVASTQMDTLQGSVKILASTWDVLKVTLGSTAQEGARGVVVGLTEHLRDMTRWIKQNRDEITSFFDKLFKSIENGVGHMADFVALVPRMVQELESLARVAAVTAGAAGIGLLITKIIALGGVMEAASLAVLALRLKLMALTTAMSALNPIVLVLVAAVGTLAVALEQERRAFEAAIAGTDAYKESLGQAMDLHKRFSKRVNDEVVPALIEEARAQQAVNQGRKNAILLAIEELKQRTVRGATGQLGTAIVDPKVVKEIQKQEKALFKLNREMRLQEIQLQNLESAESRRVAAILEEIAALEDQVAALEALNEEEKNRLTPEQLEALLKKEKERAAFLRKLFAQPETLGFLTVPHGTIQSMLDYAKGLEAAANARKKLNDQLFGPGRTSPQQAESLGFLLVPTGTIARMLDYANAMDEAAEAAKKAADQEKRLRDEQEERDKLKKQLGEDITVALVEGLRDGFESGAVAGLINAFGEALQAAVSHAVQTEALSASMGGVATIVGAYILSEGYAMYQKNRDRVDHPILDRSIEVFSGAVTRMDEGIDNFVEAVRELSELARDARSRFGDLSRLLGGVLLTGGERTTTGPGSGGGGPFGPGEGGGGPGGGGGGIGASERSLQPIFDPAINWLKNLFDNLMVPEIEIWVRQVGDVFHVSLGNLVGGIGDSLEEAFENAFDNFARDLPQLIEQGLITLEGIPEAVADVMRNSTAQTFDELLANLQLAMEIYLGSLGPIEADIFTFFSDLSQTIRDAININMDPAVLGDFVRNQIEAFINNLWGGDLFLGLIDAEEAVSQFSQELLDLNIPLLEAERLADLFAQGIERFNEAIKLDILERVADVLEQMAETQEEEREVAKLRARVDQARFLAEVTLLKANLETLHAAELITSALHNRLQGALDDALNWARDWRNFLEEPISRADVSRPGARGDDRDEFPERVDVRIVEDLTKSPDIWRRQFEKDLLARIKSEQASGDISRGLQDTLAEISHLRQLAAYGPEGLGGSPLAIARVEQLRILLLESVRDAAVAAVEGLTSAGAARQAMQAQLDVFTDAAEALDLLADEGIDVTEAMKALTDAEKQLRLELETGVLTRLFSFFEGTGKHEEEILELKKAQKVIELETLKAQLEVLEIFHLYEDVWNEAMALVVEGLDNATGAVTDLSSAIETLQRHRDSLRGGAPGAADVQRFFATRARFNILAQQALSGDVSAVSELTSIHSQLVGSLGVLSQGMASSIFNETLGVLNQIQQQFQDQLDGEANHGQATARYAEEIAGTAEQQVSLQTEMRDHLAYLADRSDAQHERLEDVEQAIVNLTEQMRAVV